MINKQTVKDRRRDREFFVNKHRQFISENQSLRYNVYAVRVFIDQVVRVELAYSSKTFNGDIWWSMQCTYRDIFGEKIHTN